MNKLQARTLRINDKVWINEYNRIGVVVGYHEQNGNYHFYVKYWQSDDREMIEQISMDKLEIYEP